MISGVKIFRYIVGCFFLLSVLWPSSLLSQEVRVEAALDTSRMRIGEQVKVDIYLNYDAREKIDILWPEIGDTLTDKVDVISTSVIDTTFPNKTNSSRIFQHQQITISVYDSGYYAIPGFKFVVNGDTTKPVFTNPLFLQVHTVPTDTSASKIKDIKPPFEEPFSWSWYKAYFYWGLGVIAAIIIIIILIKRYGSKGDEKVAEPEKPKVPAHITALASLERIRKQQIWKEGRVKEYYSSISDTIRLYIEDRFSVHALESTTDEIMTAFRSQVVDPESKNKLQQLLSLSDLVKFAKLTPIEVEHDLTLKNAFDFVNGTKREEAMEIQPQQEKPANP